MAGKCVKSTIWWDEGRTNENIKTQSYENVRRWSCAPGHRSWSNLTVWGEDQLAYKGSNDWHYGPAPLPLEEGHNRKGKHVNCLIFNWLKVYNNKKTVIRKFDISNLFLKNWPVCRCHPSYWSVPFWSNTLKINLQWSFVSHIESTKMLGAQGHTVSTLWKKSVDDQKVVLAPLYPRQVQLAILRNWSPSRPDPDALWVILGQQLQFQRCQAPNLVTGIHRKS